MRRLPIAMSMLVALAGVIVLVVPANAAQTARFARQPASGPAGTRITVSSITPCPANPAMVTGPRVVDVTASRGSTSLGSVRLSPQASGAWSGTLTVSSRARAGAVTLDAFCRSSAQAEGATLAYASRVFTVTSMAAPAQAVPGQPTFTG